MGPHSSECGNTPTAGAAAFTGVLQWGRTHLSAETSRGAASNGIRSRLQWGRTHLSAETSGRPCHEAPKKRQLQWGRTHLSAETRGPALGSHAGSSASMGPHSSECGNFGQATTVTPDGTLQWGRTHLSAETCGRRRDVPQQVPASMGPHSSECGNPLLAAFAGIDLHASMGPHSSECGNRLAEGIRHVRITELQWGRTHLSAETVKVARTLRTSAKRLQWGRTHLSAETSVPVKEAAELLALQWGRTHLSAETCASR